MGFHDVRRFGLDFDGCLIVTDQQFGRIYIDPQRGRRMIG